MATKNLSRTVVEGGRRGRYGERYVDRRVKRAVKAQLARGEEDPIEPVATWVTSEFSDRLAPVERFLQSNKGRPWNKVYSELCKKFDRRTLKGYHLLSAHVDRHMVDGHGLGAERAAYRRLHSYGAWVDRNGILRYTQRRRWGR